LPFQPSSLPLYLSTSLSIFESSFLLLVCTLRRILRIEILFLNLYESMQVSISLNLIKEPIDSWQNLEIIFLELFYSLHTLHDLFLFNHYVPVCRLNALRRLCSSQTWKSGHRFIRTWESAIDLFATPFICRLSRIVSMSSLISTCILTSIN
jgi:hypothetical protein